jgi:tetratricopeptide (TPR) repeat protein
VKISSTFRLAALGLWAVLALGPIWAQQGGTTPPTAGGGGTTPSPPPTTPTYNEQEQARRDAETDRLAKYSTSYPDMSKIMDHQFSEVWRVGKVVLEDGTSPPEPVAIELVCAGAVRPMAFTDSKGKFILDSKQNLKLITLPDFDPDKDMPWARLIRNDRDSCSCRASLPGYQSDVVPWSTNAGDNRYEPFNLVIVLHRGGNVVGTTISLVSLQAPKSARKAFEKGRAALQKQNWKEARKQYQKAVDLYPQYAAAWSGLGAVLERLSDMAGARNAYSRASTADPLYVYPWIQLSGLAAKAENWQELLDTTNQALKLDPLNYPDVYIYNAMARLNLRDFDAAEKSAREGLKLDTERRFPQINHLLGVIMARRGDLPAAIGYMKSYLRLARDANDARIVRNQLAEVEKLAQSSPTAAP